MKSFFLAWMLLYLAHALYNNRTREAGPVGQTGALLLLIQLPLVLLALYYALVFGAFSRELFQLPMLCAGLLAGHLLFGLSLLATHQHLGDTLAQMSDLRGLFRFLGRNPDIVMRFTAVSFTEELIYRVAAQGILTEITGRPWLAVAAVAAAFAVVHWHFFRNPPVQSVEFTAFSVLLGALYLTTGSLLLVVAVHTVRNLNIVYVEYLVKVDELGAEEPAQAAMEELYRVKKTNKGAAHGRA